MYNFITWETLEFKKLKGKEKLRCPSCDGQRTDKKDRSLLINHNEGYGKCFYCEALTFQESEEIHRKTEIEYKIPAQTWRNYTNLSDAMVKWLETRKIPQSTAIELGWTEEKYYQPQLKKEVVNLCFNFFEGENVVNKKYRSGGKKFTQSTGTKSIFYNINSVIGQDEAYIVEGEIDAASLHSVGVKNVISVPNGANDNDEYWKQSEPYLKNIKRFVIAVDKDVKGNELKEKIAQRLGRYRCEFIEWEGKDANEDLISGVLEKTVLQRKRFPVSGTFTVSDLMPDILNLYDNGLPSTYTPKAKVFGNMNDVYSTMRGQLNVGTGIPSHGKSNFTDWYVLNLVNDYKMKASWFSPEHSPMSLYQTNIMEKVIGKNFWGTVGGYEVERITKQEIEDYHKWANEKIYLTDAVSGEFPTWDWLLEKFKEQMYSFGIDIFVIDAFNKVLLPNGNRLEEISKVLTKLTHFAQSNNVIVFLIAHPTKMRKDDAGIYGVPTLYDVSGSADFRNMTHNGYTIYRYFQDDNGQENETEFINMKTKFSFQGKMQESVKFKYCNFNGRFYANNVEPTYSMILDNEDYKPKELPKLNPVEAFDEEVPF
jgi:twinkle protein